MRYVRSLSPVSWASQEVLRIPIKGHRLVSSVIVELEGSMVVAAGGITVRDESSHNLIAEVEIRGDEQSLVRIPFRMLKALNFFQRGVLPPTVTSGLTEATHGVRAVGVLHLKNFGSGAAGQTVLDPSRFTNLELVVTCGSVAAAVASGTATFSGSIRSQVVEVDRSDVPDLSSQLRVLHRAETFSAASADATIRMPDNLIYRALLVRGSDSATGYALSDAVINSVKLMHRATDNLFQATWQGLQNLNQVEQYLAETYQTPGIAGAKVEGYGWIDFVELSARDHFNPGRLPFDLILDVDASSRVDVVALCVLPVGVR